MSKRGGQSTYKGINSQSWAAMSIFLQYVRTSDFHHIAFEQDKLKDFDLVFNDGRKIICESKTSQITYGLLRDMLGHLTDNDKVGDKDEILIICSEVSQSVKNAIEGVKYHEHYRKTLKDKKFTSKQIELLPKVRVWEVDQTANEIIVNSLMAEILNAWVPDKIFHELVNNILIDRIYKGSETGGTLSKKEFYHLIDDRRRQIQTDAGYTNKQNQKLARIDKVISAINNPNSQDWCNNEISLLSTIPDLYYLTVKKLEKIPQLKLSLWDNLWQASAKGAFTLQIFDIFQKNLEDSDNQEYLMTFLPTVVENLLSYYRQEFIIYDIVKICSGVVNKTRIYDSTIFELIKSLNNASHKQFLYVSPVRTKEWENEKLAGLFKLLFEEADNTLKEKIIAYIYTSYNLIADDGEYWHYTPNEIFEILKLYVIEDIQSRIEQLKQLLVKQYKDLYKGLYGKDQYGGWEHMGFTSTDRHFVTYILEPILNHYYDINPDLAWNYITKQLITRTESRVSSSNPDFLNRASIGVILRAFMNPKYNDEAYGILKDFVEMKRGIPHKTEIIYRQLRDLDMSNDQKWRLLNLQLSFEPYGYLPVNKHVESLVRELANKGHLEALNTLEAWSENPDFNKYIGVIEGNISVSISSLLKNTNTLSRGVKMFGRFIRSEYFINKQGLWDVWKTAEVLKDLLSTDFIEGKKLIDEIWNKNVLSKNEQVLITNAINAIDKENKKLIANVYEKIVSKWLTDCNNDIKCFVRKINDIQSRNSIVQFGDKLVQISNYEGAINIAKVFIDDPDPTLENADDDPKGDRNYHEQIKNGKEANHITTVRVWVTWILQGISVLKGRKYIHEIIPMVERLTLDPHYYVRAYACIALEQLTRARHTVMPHDRKERFISIEDANKIEQIAYRMLLHR